VTPSARRLPLVLFVQVALGLLVAVQAGILPASRHSDLAKVASALIGTVVGIGGAAFMLNRRGAADSFGSLLGRLGQVPVFGSPKVCRATGFVLILFGVGFAVRAITA
jgi:hypothetical protein